MSRYEKLAEFFNSQEMPEQQAIDDYKRQLESDMVAHLGEMVLHGWIDQQTADEDLFAFHNALYGIPKKAA